MGSAMKTIIYVGGFELPDKNAAAHRVLNNAKCLRALGCRVVFLGISHTEKETSEQEYDGFRCVSVPYPQGLGQWLGYLTDCTALKKLIGEEKPDGVIFYNYQAAALAKALRYCKKRHILTVADVTEWYLAEGNPIFRLIKTADTSLRMKRYHKRADGVIAISAYLEEYYRKDMGDRVVRIPPLIDKDEPKWADVPRGRRNDDRIRLIYAGSTTDIKDNIAVVLEGVFPYRDKVSLTVVGTSEADLGAYLREKGKEHLLGDYLEALGRLPHTECLKKIGESDFQIFIREDNLVTRAGFPTKLGESFACGTPVITNPSSNVADYMADGQTGYLVDGTDADAVRAVMQRVSRLTAEEILAMKEHCREIGAFEYGTYIHVLDAFFKQIGAGNSDQ